MHNFLTPVFGTSCPPKGVAGIVRKFAYRRLSEARAQHWFILLAADRVDVLESRLQSFLTGRPDDLVAETGVRAEVAHGGLASRVRRGVPTGRSRRWTRSLPRHRWAAAGFPYVSVRARARWRRR